MYTALERRFAPAFAQENMSWLRKSGYEVHLAELIGAAVTPRSKQRLHDLELDRWLLETKVSHQSTWWPDSIRISEQRELDDDALLHVYIDYRGERIETIFLVPVKDISHVLGFAPALDRELRRHWNRAKKNASTGVGWPRRGISAHCLITGADLIHIVENPSSSFSGNARALVRRGALPKLLAERTLPPQFRIFDTDTQTWTRSRRRVPVRQDDRRN